MAPQQLYADSAYAPEVFSETAYPEVVKDAPEVVSGPHHKAWFSNNGSASSHTRRTVCGISLALFMLIFSLIGIIVIGTAVGGGVGGIITAQNNQKLATAQDDVSSAKASVIAALSSASAAYSQGFAAGQAATKPTAVADNASNSTTMATRTMIDNAAATVTIASSFPAMTPVSDCKANAGTDWTAGPGKLRFTRLCSTSMDGTVKAMFQGVVTSFTECIKLCDSYNAWSSTNSTNIASFNFSGKGADMGMCWCRHGTPGQYGIKNDTAYDSAYLAGTFDQSSFHFS